MVQQQGVPLKVLYWNGIMALETELFGKPLGGVNASQRLIKQLVNGEHKHPRAYPNRRRHR
jgi:hypothetical protein